MPPRRGRNPLIMVAPNGARRGKEDHPGIPLTVAETARAAATCRVAGAVAVHAHVRDRNGKHTLDAGLYRELIEAVGRESPGMPVQVTTESAGLYSPGQQRALLYELRPAWASAAVAEMTADGDLDAAGRLYGWAPEHGVELQHIVYSPEEIARLASLVEEGVVPESNLSVLMVLGRYSPPTDAEPEMLEPYLAAARALPGSRSLMACAFGPRETDCLVAAAKAGCDCRIGFENNLLNRDGKTAADNAERVRELAGALDLEFG